MQWVFCSEALEEVGEVPGSAQVPQHVVEQADSVDHLYSLQLKLSLVLLDLGLAHVAGSLLLVVPVDAKEVPLVLEAGRQGSVPNHPVGGQLHLKLQRGAQREKERSWHLEESRPQLHPTP